jgi:hypothetical protein
MFFHEGDLNHLVRLVRVEYLEMPGLRLTKPQAQRLWGLDAPTCDKVLKTLVSARFLRRTPTDSYARVDLEH